jgi:hypothetical protein
VVWLQKQALKRRKVKQFEQLQQTLMLNPHIPSRNEENAQKLKENEFLPVMRAGLLNNWCKVVISVIS